MGRIHLDAFQVIADPGRRRMLQLLSERHLSINALAANFDMSRPAVSKHVKILEGAGFVTIKDLGRERYCMLNYEGFHELREWMRYYDQFWAQKMQDLKILMDGDSSSTNL